MITPRLRGGHEVTKPVFVAGAEIGDGIAIRIRDITVTSIATASGHDSLPEGFCLGDPYVAARCPVCDTVWPETHIEGIGQDSVKCDACGNAVTPFAVVHGYTVTFDDTRSVGLTLPQQAAEDIARQADHYAALPDASHQHSTCTTPRPTCPARWCACAPSWSSSGPAPPSPCPTATMPGISEPSEWMHCTNTASRSRN